MSSTNAVRDDMKRGHESLEQYDAAVMVMGLTNCIKIELEGVDIVRGYHEKHGNVTLVMPAAGQSCLLYPFEK
jgi:hypothetical protein